MSVGPVYLQNLLKTTASVPGWASNCSASNNDLVKQSIGFKLGQCAFSVAGQRVWNQLLLTSEPSWTLMLLSANLNLFYFCHHTLSTQ